MKALSLLQPWASAMAAGVKRNETRSWPTKYRGDLVICSSKRRPTQRELIEMDPEAMAAALEMPYGYALCVVELYDCRDVEWVSAQLDFTDAENDLGDYTPGIGRYAWLTRNCRKLVRPIGVVGTLGVFNLDDGTAHAIAAQFGYKWNGELPQTFVTQ